MRGSWWHAPKNQMLAELLGPLLLATLNAQAEPSAAWAGPPRRQELKGLLVVLSPGHGKHMHISVDGHTRLTWDFQRKPSHGLTEDLWTSAFVADHLAPALEARGATVLSLRERDRHEQLLWADDSDDAFEVSSGWPVAWAEAHAGGHHMVLPKGHAVWRFRVPEDGRWHLSTRWTAETGRSSQVRVELVSGDQRVRTSLDQTRHGDVWWPLGSLDVSAGDEVTVRMHAQDAPFVADALRVGGGTYVVDDPGWRGHDRAPVHEVASVHLLDRLGGPASLLLEDDGTPLSDMRFRARWASWMVDQTDDALFLSIHTNAGRGHGSTVYVGHDDDARPPVPEQPRSRQLAEALSTELRSQLIEQVPSWRHRGVWTGDLSEISPYWNHLDAALVELGFHDSAHDTTWLKDEAFLERAAAAIADGVVSWRSLRAPKAPVASLPAP
jgi:N-acetylmuramoyl-L-alanine amidase